MLDARRLVGVGLILIGSTLVVAVAVSFLRPQLAANLTVERFEAASEEGAVLEEPASIDLPVLPEFELAPVSVLDQSGWSRARITAFLTEPRVPVIGTLRIPELQIVAPVFGGSSDDALNAGVGWIEGTAPLNQRGNTGLAGHRDSFFRGLKDVQVGQMIEVTTRHRRKQYRVTGHEIVLPSGVSVLAPSDTEQLTLVTCYPFYFVGAAPMRFVVFAEAIATP